MATRRELELKEIPEKGAPEEVARIYARIKDTLQANVVNFVWRVFATKQPSYERAVDILFARLDWLEQRLTTQRYLVGGQLTEADVRLFTTLARFDAVYVGHFKCNLRRLVDYPNLWGYARDLFQRLHIFD